MSSLADSLALVSAHLPREIVDPANLAAAEALSRRLPAIHRAGFECRLGPADETTVDLQQGILAPQRALLSAHLDAHPVLPAALARFVTSWSRSTSALGIQALWLEFDRADLERLSLFLAPSADVSRELALESIEAALEECRAPAIASWKRVVGQLEALPPWVRVAQAGMMCSRPGLLRVNLAGLRYSELGLLRRVLGWSGDEGALKTWADRLFPLAASLNVCLDVGDRVLPGVGLECFLPFRHPLWPRLLGELEAAGVAAPARSAALLRWPEQRPAPPPASRWLTSLSEPRRSALTIPVLRRKLSHVKVTLPGEGPATAKAYFGYLVRYLSPPTAAHTPVPPTPRRRPAADPSTAIRRALPFLLDQRDAAGWWRDFPSLGASDEWVSAYVGAVLAELELSEAQEAARRVWHLLTARQRQGGWGYSAHKPPDADSTAWALRLASLLGHVDEPAAVEARAFLEAHQDAGGGIRTYVPSALQEHFAREGWAERPSAGWCGTHPCVSATAALACRLPRLLDYVEREQQATGVWEAYWWDEPAYATALACEALAQGGRPLSLAVRASSGLGAGDPQDPFALALRTRTAVAARDEHRARALASQLCALQLADGSWQGTARLRVPLTGAVSPRLEPEGAAGLDRGVFTTATALSALHKLLRMHVDTQGPQRLARPPLGS